MRKKATCMMAHFQNGSFSRIFVVFSKACLHRATVMYNLLYCRIDFRKLLHAVVLPRLWQGNELESQVNKIKFKLKTRG